MCYLFIAMPYIPNSQQTIWLTSIVNVGGRWQEKIVELAEKKKKKKLKFNRTFPNWYCT